MYVRVCVQLVQSLSSAPADIPIYLGMLCVCVCVCVCVCMCGCVVGVSRTRTVDYLLLIRNWVNTHRCFVSYPVCRS
jgi:hypothetical protein